MNAGVFVCGHSGVPGGVVEAFLQDASLGLSAVEFCCASEAPSSTQQKRYGVALLSNPPTSLPQPSHSQGAIMATISRRLLPGAVLYVHDQESARGVQSMQRDLLLNGFVDDQPLASLPPSLGLMVKARRPDYEIGAKAPLSLKRPGNTPTPVAPAPSTWQLNNEDDEMLDDEELLTEEDKARPEVPAAGDCSTSRKACKNCSCGRAEKEAAGERVQLTQEMLDNPQSSCGSCTLGDAFRCAGCPYRGLPPFEQGKKIQLGSDFLTADA
ncbi:cytokine-induced anti-apoptosis inhibitor 1, Fe-S biogenesis-domain-containing protein [Dunaliella salina]|uniref:Anamorsin homolog n=1 Tax=Dunaliella salina TaxID=3046 RepID=A0ABQ7GPG0_DUNSA|nr:cytokine-induced anti-apoptosis inhibitor 1, Fe-S biogenesis-domain-containing protein [Dunaliella salina]|eukprot:KAF5836490.1 cytokine-induced anti-apoptosis inhibitor 1, Fe-S biogenesis-domain-containing protein [Dunaliella salina]